MKLFKKKKVEIKESPRAYYPDDLEEVTDWENYYGENYGEDWL